MSFVTWSHHLSAVVDTRWFLSLEPVQQGDFRLATIGTKKKADLPKWARELLTDHRGVP